MRKKWLLSVLAVVLLVPFIHAVTGDANIWSLNGKGVRRDTPDIQLYENTVGGLPTLYLSGDIKIGDTGSGTPTLPTTTTATQWGLKVPFYNSSGATLARGSVLIGSGTVAGSATSAATTSLATVVGVCDGVVAAWGTGWMTVSGYAAVLTTGTVAIGNLLVSTAGSNGSGAAGYAGAIASAATVEAGTIIGKAMSVGTAAGGLTIVKLGE